jgi:tRNA A-37 threonylcarbamoyl transferase component Bud32/tetratricopeptide (TPR) repeat protein
MDLADRLREAVADRYAVERELGRGGMAVVYLARDLRHERRVAIKVLRPELTVSLVADRFLREIQIAAQLQHPLIVPLHDSGGTDELLWYVMPFIEGETLRQRLQREGQLPLDDALQITQDAAAALQCAHDHGFVHRDIKPENILLSGGHALLADFGIARALTRAAGEGTSSGVAIGTPAYMSPEQAAGGAVIDARSDIYSLGCVVYEMLAGEPPFTGPTPQAVIARHVSERTPSVRVVRPAVPEEVASAIERALAKTPADRFGSAHELIEALTAPRAERPRPKRTAIGGRVAVGVVSAAVAVLLYWLVPRIVNSGELNPSQHVLAPFLEAGAGVDRELSKLWEQELTSAFRQVPNITVVEATLVNDRRLRRPGDPSDFGYWLQVAKDLRAGRLVVPSLVRAGDSSRVVAELYEVRGGRALRRAGVTLAADVGASDVAARLAERMFDLPGGVLQVSRSTVEGAQRAFVAGKAALESWGLRAAEARFQEAATLDPDYGHAHFWLAQTKAWAGDSPDQWIGAARRAAMAGALADSKERVLAAALLAMAERQFPHACALYDSLVATDSLSFEAWFGLGECHAKDDLVLPDRASRSGFRFRTGYHTAARAYERALEVAPSFAFQFRPLSRFTGVLNVEPSQLRAGRGSQDTTPTWGAFASLDHDTLAFIPWPLDSIRAGSPGVFSSQLNEAVARNRQRLLRMVTNWVRIFPDSSDGYQALALALELTGALDGSGDVERSALAAARRARSTTRQSFDSVRNGVAEVRVLVKLGRFDEAQRIGMATLRRWDAPGPEAADELDGLAALVGRPHLAAQLAARAAMRPGALGAFPAAFPATIIRTRRAFEAYAALGAPADSIAALAERLDQLLEIGVPPPVARQFRCSEEAVSLGRAFPQLKRVTQESRCRMGAPMLEMQWALLNHDAAAVRKAFERGRAMRRIALPGDIALDHVFHETWVLLQVGDTATARDYLDRTLAALSALRTTVSREPLQAGALVRAMALRAELAAAAGDRTTARRWAEPVTILWRDSDPELRPIVERMRRFVASR